MEKNISELVGLDSEELFILLGEELQKSRLDLKNSEDPGETGKKSFAKYSIILKEKICTNEKIVFFLESSGAYDSIQIISAIMDAITGYFTGLSLMTVSILIARKGLIEYCSIKNKQNEVG